MYTVEDEITNKQIKDNTDKAKLNLDKFFQMLNRKDYLLAYNVLDNEFKNKYFSTQEQFEKYLSDNFYEFNNYYIQGISKGQDEYKIEIKITDSLNNNTESGKIKRFKVNIKEKNEYSISFNI